jgi:serine/threonine-protein kinase
MAEVYRGRDRALGREVAVKVLPPSLASDAGYVRRFREEARWVAALDHPNIVPVYQYGEQQGLLFIVMPLLHESLREKLGRLGRLPAGDAMHLVVQVAAALDAAHTQGIIHRDVKPENILLNPEGRALLTDFGIAREATALRDPQVARTLSPTGLPVGTPEYMAPEQLRMLAVDARADIYALGAVLYEMLTGRAPHEAPTAYEVAALVLTAPLMPPSAHTAEIWPELEAVVVTALASAPENRFPDMRSFALALRTALHKRPEHQQGMAKLTVPALQPLEEREPGAGLRIAASVPVGRVPAVVPAVVPVAGARSSAYGGAAAAGSGAYAAGSLRPPALIPAASVPWPRETSEQKVARRRMSKPVAALLVLAVVGVLLGGVVILGGLGNSQGHGGPQSTLGGTSTTALQGTPGGTGVPSATGQPGATGTPGAGATAPPTGTITATATNTPTTPPLLTLDPGPPVQVQLTSGLAGMCMTSGGGLSQTVTNPGSHAIRWSDVGFPAGTRWDFNNTYSQSGQPGDSALAGGRSDTLYIEVPCLDSGPPITFNVTMTDGANRTYTFTVYVKDN